MEQDDETMTIEHLLRRVPEGEETIFDLLDEGGDKVKTIEIKRRKLQPELPQQLPEPEISRAQARNHVFNDLDSFADYLVRCGNSETSVVLADTESRIISAVLDESNEFDRERVLLQAIQHPLFVPWQRLLQGAIPVIDFALFIMQNRRAVVEPDGRELAMIFSQVKMSKSIAILSGVGKKSLNGVMVDVEIAGERKGMAVDLPETIAIEVPLFVGTSAQRIEIDLLVTNKGENVVVYATAADVEHQKIIAFEEMVKRLKESTGHLVGLGTIAHRDWRTVPLSK